MQGYADIINSIKLSREIIPDGPSRLHIAGAVTQNAKNALAAFQYSATTGGRLRFGRTILLNPDTSIIAYAWDCGILFAVPWVYAFTGVTVSLDPTPMRVNTN